MWSLKGFGLLVGHYSGKQKDLGSIPFELSSVFRSVVYGHCGFASHIVTINETLQWLSQ